MKIKFVLLFTAFNALEINASESQADQKKALQITVPESESGEIIATSREETQKESLEDITKEITDIIVELKSESNIIAQYVLLKNLERNVVAYQTKSPIKKDLSKQIEEIKKIVFNTIYEILLQSVPQAILTIEILQKNISDAQKGIPVKPWRPIFKHYNDPTKTIIIIMFPETFANLYQSYADKAQKDALKTNIDKFLLKSSGLLIFLEREIRKHNFDHFSLYMEISRDYDQIQNIGNSLEMYKSKSDNTKKRKELYDLRQKMEK
jgi:hypothetical protein